MRTRKQAAIRQSMREFTRWRNAWDKPSVAMDQVQREVDTGPDFSNGPLPPDVFDLVMPNGKRFGDCTAEDLEEFAQWKRALSAAWSLWADILKQVLQEREAQARGARNPKLGHLQQSVAPTGR